MIDQQEPQYAPLPPITGGIGGPWPHGRPGQVAHDLTQ